MNKPANSFKTCARCGRVMTWRRKWAHQWEQIRYCSKRCSRARLRQTDHLLEKAIFSLLCSRSGTICPSEAARVVAPENWRDLMEPARCAGRRMAARGEVVFKQSGKTVDPSEFKGLVRLDQGPKFHEANPGDV
ncbi:MAG TPA: DUF2256 and DUF3253 domain-containing protein [Xanthomonadales bacterium]|nr:DUF2256 and DUF3253 domain-containing protein [Xanthomonadales bacterium]